MPWKLALCAVLGGCWFDADYRGGHYACSDGVCPSGLTCVQDVCTTPVDAGHDAAIDARIAAGTCVEPTPIAGTLAGDTTARQNLVTAMCAGFVMNGHDAVFHTDAAHALVEITGALQAYALASCDPAPAEPTCVGNAVAIAGNPISIAGPAYIVVDQANPSISGAFTLTVTEM